MAEPRRDDDETPSMPPGWRAFRFVQIGVYLAFAVAIPVYVHVEGRTGGTLLMLTWLLCFYMAARALAIFIRYRQETRPPRYTKAYTEARDLFEDKDEKKPGDGDLAPPDKSNGRTRG